MVKAELQASATLPRNILHLQEMFKQVVLSTTTRQKVPSVFASTPQRDDNVSEYYQMSSLANCKILSSSSSLSTSFYHNNDQKQHHLINVSEKDNNNNNSNQNNNKRKRTKLKIKKNKSKILSNNYNKNEKLFVKIIDNESNESNNNDKNDNLNEENSEDKKRRIRKRKIVNKYNKGKTQMQEKKELDNSVKEENNEEDEQKDDEKEDKNEEEKQKKKILDDNRNYDQEEDEDEDDNNCNDNKKYYNNVDGKDNNSDDGEDDDEDDENDNDNDNDNNYNNNKNNDNNNNQDDKEKSEDKRTEEILPKLNAVNDKFTTMVKVFRKRANKFKRKLLEPISIENSLDDININERKDDKLLTESWNDVDWLVNDIKQRSLLDECKYRLFNGEIGVFDSQGYFYINWLLIVSLAFLYNCWIIFLRASFPYQTSNNLKIYLLADYLADLIYLIDILFFKCRLQFYENGQLIRDSKLSRKHYMKSSMFKYDCLALFPLDILYLLFGPMPILRLTRAFKLPTFWEFFDRIDAIAKWPYLIRIIRTLIYMMFLVHLNTCAYYYLSYLEGFNHNDWVYNNEGNAYLRCFYFAIRTATSISGKMPKPTNIYEYLFMTASWLFGIFVFAFLIGQIRDIVATANANEAHFRSIMDSSIRYMSNLNLPTDLQYRVRQWLSHTWENQKTFDENEVLSVLPMKMKTDIARDIHFNMLSKVELFKECDRMVLRDIVVKLRPVLFLPNAFICQKNEIGHEMYIVNNGYVQVISDNGEILAKMGPGSVFGEISVLGIPGLSKRTANVQSIGYSNLFVLSKADLWETLRNYPEAQRILRAKASKVMKERKINSSTDLSESNNDLDDNLIKRQTTPKLLTLTMQLISPNAKCRQLLNSPNRSEVCISSPSIFPNISESKYSNSIIKSSNTSENDSQSINSDLIKDIIDKIS